jgi:hypothetical protein
MPREKNQIEIYTGKLNESSKKVSNSHVKQPNSLLLQLTLLANRPRAKIDISNPSSALNMSGHAIAETRSLLSYQAASFDALKDVLSYEPVADFANFSAGTNSTNARLDRAKEALDTCHSKLTALHYPDDSLDDVIKEVSGLQDALNNLRDKHDTAAWTTAVGAAQRNIIDNRGRFWDSHSKDIMNQLQNADSELGEIEFSLSQIQ